MADDEEAMVRVKKVPKPKDEMPSMPAGASPAERPMPLEHDFHVTDIQRVTKKGNAGQMKGGAPTRPGAKVGGDPMTYLKQQQSETANSVT